MLDYFAFDIIFCAHLLLQTCLYLKKKPVRATALMDYKKRANYVFMLLFFRRKGVSKNGDWKTSVEKPNIQKL